MHPDLHRPPWVLALAAFALTLATACGADVPSAPADISDPVERIGEPTAPPPVAPDEPRRQLPESPLVPGAPAPPVYGV